MALSDDNDVFVGGEFGVSCTAGSKTGFAILSEPSQVMADGQVLFSDYSIRAKASEFGNLQANDEIFVNSVAYTVRETMFDTDGQLVTISLQKT
nr:hypothetical protein [uncultured Mediterranean phage uvMED]